MDKNKMVELLKTGSILRRKSRTGAVFTHSHRGSWHTIPTGLKEVH